MKIHQKVIGIFPLVIIISFVTGCSWVPRNSLPLYQRSVIIENQEMVAQILSRAIRSFSAPPADSKYAIGKQLPLNKLKKTRKEMKTISDETISAILTYLKENRHNKVNRFYEVFFRLLFDTGIRLNEIRHLKIQNVHMLVPKVRLVVTKTDRERTVFFSKYTHEILIDYIHTHELKNEFLFPGKLGEIISDGAVYSKLRNLKKAIGFSESCSPHAWRHTFGTNWVDSDSQPHLLQKIMGHSKYETTQRYIHQNEKSQLRLYENFIDKRGDF